MFHYMAHRTAATDIIKLPQKLQSVVL